MSYLTNLWDKIMLKLGAAAALIPILAAELHIHIKAGDVTKARAIAFKIKEKCAEGTALAEATLAATEDGELTLVEGSDIALKLEALID